MRNFQEPNTPSKNKINFELYISDYATKTDLKSATSVDSVKFAEKADLTS